jgi:hypothetical protein
MCDGFGSEGTGQNCLGYGEQGGESSFGSLDRFGRQVVSNSEFPFGLVADDAASSTTIQLVTDTDLGAAHTMQPFNSENTYAFDDFPREMPQDDNRRESILLTIDPVDPSNESPFYFG